MADLRDKARTVVSQLVGEPVSVRHAGTTPAGEDVYEVTCLVPTTRVKVTFNPNGRRAALEWTSGRRGENYKLCDVADVTDTAEEKAVP